MRVKISAIYSMTIDMELDRHWINEKIIAFNEDVVDDIQKQRWAEMKWW